MALSLGRTIETEYKKDLQKISKGLVNKRGLLFTNEKVDTVKEWFKSHKQFCFARSGSIATETVVLPEGPLDLPHPMEPQLRQLGLPTRLKDGEFICQLIGISSLKPRKIGISLNFYDYDIVFNV